MRHHVDFSTGAENSAKGSVIRQEKSWVLTGKMKETSSYTDKYQNIFQLITATEGARTIPFPFLQSHIPIGKHMEFLLYPIRKKYLKCPLPHPMQFVYFWRLMSRYDVLPIPKSFIPISLLKLSRPGL